jgi:hypothetical protein
LLADADELAGKDAGFGQGLLGLAWIPLGALGGLEDEGLSLLLYSFELEDVSVELAGVVADQLVTFAELGVLKSAVASATEGLAHTHLRGGVRLPEDGPDRLHGRGLRLAAGDRRPCRSLAESTLQWPAGMDDERIRRQCRSTAEPQCGVHVTP